MDSDRAELVLEHQYLKRLSGAADDEHAVADLDLPDIRLFRQEAGDIAFLVFVRIDVGHQVGAIVAAENGDDPALPFEKVAMTVEPEIDVPDKIVHIAYFVFGENSGDVFKIPIIDPVGWRVRDE